MTSKLDIDDLDFSCTSCGKCCQTFKLPLTVNEAICWLERGNDVQVICEAVPWVGEPPEGDSYAEYWWLRSFPASSNKVPVRVGVILAANFTGACPNLNADMRCGAYMDRPLACQIYPTEKNPFVVFNPSRKACPPDAWNLGRTPFRRKGVIVDTRINSIIEQARLTEIMDARTKEIACVYLRLETAALVNEGFVVHSPGRIILLDALKKAIQESAPVDYSTSWRFISNQRQTIDAITSGGASCLLVDDHYAATFEYLSVFNASS